MITNDYMRVSDLAKEKKITMRTVRNKIQKLLGIVGDGKIIKDANEDWRIHKSIRDMFTPERVHKKRYTAITIDPVYNYTTEDLENIIRWIVEITDETELEINYTIEKKKANERNHIHLYMIKDFSSKFLRSSKIAFPVMSFHVVEVYDLLGWKNYIGKETKIKTIKK